MKATDLPDGTYPVQYSIDGQSWSIAEVGHDFDGSKAIWWHFDFCAEPNNPHWNQFQFRMLVPLPDREALAKWLYFRPGHERMEDQADALLAWMKEPSHE